MRVADTRANPPGVDALREAVSAAELRTGAFAPALLDDVAQVVISPGLSMQEPVVREALERGMPVVGDIELFAREAQAPIAAITGTNGKSTVTTLVAELANAGGRRALAGGNLGEPALDLLERATPDLYVLELSSFQLETTHSLHTVTSTVLNVTPDHMDRYASLEEYGAAKARIFDGCDVAVINADDPAVRGMPRPGQSVISFSLESRAADYTLEHSPHADDRAAWRALAAARRDAAAGPAQRGERDGRARAWPKRSRCRSRRRSRRCARSAACRIVRNGSPMSAACVT